MGGEAVTGCVIVTGMPGAGKTTITSLVARVASRGTGWRRRRQPHDPQRCRLVHGRTAEEALRQDELCNRNMCGLANNFIDFGFTVLMDTVLAGRSELDFFLALMSPRPVRLLVLDPGTEVCRARNASREPDEQFEFDAYGAPGGGHGS